MARLIPQKQIEEINIFKDSISVNNSVFISGSLLVSQSFDLGSDPNTIQRITGSVEVTGSLTLDGPLTLTQPDIRLEATASFADVSLDTRLFGGIRPEDFGANDSTLYVSSTSGDDNNDGRTPQFSLRTIKKAAKIATDGDDGRYGLPTGSLFTGFRIEVAAGTYLEDNPIELPKNTTVWGAGLRVTKVLAKNETEDLFWVNSGNYLAEMTFGNLRVFPSVDNSQKGFAVSFAPNAFITTSPYVQNCSMISNQENSFLEAYEPIPPGGGGLNVDGNRIHPDSPLASMVLDAYTQVAPNGVGCQVVGRGFIQLVSFFTNFSAYSVKVLDGGQAVLLNSNTSFGNFGMFASGSRFITGSGGNQDAFLNVQDNYSIIVNTIEQGLSAIPPVVPNTENGIRATDPLQYPQYFVSEDSSAEVADIVKSDFNLVSSIIQTADSNTPSLIAKSSTKGYSPSSVYNISGIEQVLSETTASIQDISKVDTNFDILLDIIERGNAATESYSKVSNVSESIQVTNNTQVKAGITDLYYQDISDSRFDTIISIVQSGLSATPSISSNVSSSIVSSVDLFYQTDITASNSTIQTVSASFALVYNIVENGTGSLPNTILSSSIENPSIEIQNAYTLLIENIPFIQSETIAYLSSSWSEFEYNEASCSRDIGFIVSGAAHDLLYGGNEESLRSGIFYYQFPSDATTTQLDPTLTGIKYASGLVQNILRGREFTEIPAESIVAYDNIINNKQFIRDEVIAYVSSSWSEFEYSEEKCRRDIGYILDAVATDITYGGNERSVVAGQFYYKYPSLAIVDNRTTGQLQQTLDALKYAKRITKKLLNNDTFVTASESRIGAVNLYRENRQLIQDETIIYINTEYPNFSYNQTKCRRDVGFIVDNIATDLLYGGNERTEIAGFYYFLYPSIANTTQLTETLQAIRYVNGISNEIIKSNLLETPRIISNIDGNIRVTTFQPIITSSVSATETEVRFVSQSFGVIEDIIRYGTNSVLSAIGSNSDDFNWTLETPINVTTRTQITSSNEISSSVTESISENISTIINIIQSGSSIVTEETVGTDSKGAPISTVGIPKNSYGDNLITTVVGTILPNNVTIELNTDSGVKIGNDIQYTSSISASANELNKVSASFAIITDIIKYGISGSLEISGSSDASTYFEVVSIDGTPNAFYFNKNQIQKFDDTDGKVLGEDTGSFDDAVQDPTLTLKRGEMYTFSINNLKIERATPAQLQPFYIKTERVAGTEKQYNEGVTNNGISFGTIAFIVPFDAPDTLYYVNGNNVSASGVFNIVDNLPLSDTQRYVEIPSRGEFEVVTNNVGNLKISTLEQFTSSFNSTPSQSLQISGSFATIINILEEGLGETPTLVKNVSGLVKKTNITQYTSSIDADSNLRNSVSASFNIVLDIVRNGTGSLPTLVSNTEGNIKFTTTSQFTGSLSGSIEDIEFVSSSISIVTDIITFGSGSYETASNYVSASTEPSTLAAYEIIKENIPFIQIETIAYLSSSWKGFEYNEASCSRDIGLIISGAAEDLLWGVPSASIVNGKYYFEFPSAATSSQLNQTLDGINYASRLTQKLIQNIAYTTASLGVRNSYDILIENRPLIQSEAVAYVSSSWSGVYYNEASCSRDVGFIVDAVATDLLYGGNERSSKAGEFYYLYPSRATNAGVPSEQNQLDSTLSGINYARLFSNELLQNNIFTAASTQIIEVTKLITENKPLIQSEVISYISSSWSEFEYNEASCSRDVGYILDAVATDFFYGGNERSITAGTFYYLFPSAATGSQLTQTVDGITYAQRLTNKLINNVVLENPSDERTATYNLLFNNKELLQNEVISYISSSWSGFEYIESKCRRDVGFIVDAVATDVLYGGNERSVKAGEFYYLYPSEATTTQSDQTITGVLHAKGLSEKLIQNILLVEPNVNDLLASQLIINNKEFIQDNVIQYIDNEYPYFTYNRTKCRRDVGFIVDAIATDLIWGGNERSVIAGDYYYRFPSQATTGQLRETTEAIEYINSIIKNLITDTILPTPRIISNTENNIKFTDNEQYTDSLAISGSYLNEVSSSFGTIINVISSGLTALPTEIRNADGLIKVTNATQVTESVSVNEQLVSSSYAVVLDILQNGVEVIPTLVENTNGNIKATSTTQITSASAAGATEITKVSSSFALVERIVEGGVDELETIVYNTAGNIKVGNVSQYIGGVGGNSSDVTAISESISIVTDIIQNGTGSLPTIIEYTTPSTDVNTLAAYEILKQNIGFIQSETIAYLSSSWSTASYNEASCSRDVSLIVSGAAEDLIWNSNSASIMNGYYYYLFPSQAQGAQLNQTLDGVFYASRLAQKLIQNVVFESPSTARIAAFDLLRENTELIQNETIAYLSSSWSGHSYNETTCKRDVGYIIDAVRTDILYGGNERTNKAGEYYYLYPSNATGSELIQTLDGINYAGRLAQKVVQNTTLSNPSTSVVNSYNSILDDKSTIQSKVIAYLSSSFPTHQYNESKCSRDVGYIIDAVATDLFYGGNERSIEAGRFYYLYPSQATGYQIEETVAGIEYAQRLTEVSSQNKGTQIGIVSASIGLINDVIRLGSDNIPFAIAKNFQTSELDTPQNLTTTSYVTASGNFVEGDILTELEIVSQSFEVINTIISSGTGSIPPVVSNVASNIKVSGTEQYTLNTNGSQTEVSIVSASVDIIERIVQNGVTAIPSVIENNNNTNNLIKVGAIEQYVSASGADKLQSKIISSSFGLVIDIIANGTGSTPPIKQYINRVDAPKTVLAYELLKENIPFIQEETILFMSSSWSGFMYDEEKCRRDIGFIVSGSAEDLIWNSNSASIVNGKFYLEYPSAATGSQLDQTITAIKYASNLAQNIVRNREYVTASLEVSSSYQLLVQNKEFIVSESIAFVSSSWSDFYYNQNTCGRDVRYIVDAVATDLLYGGNERSVTAGRYYYDYPSSAIVGGIPSATQQKDPTVTAINYVKGLAAEIVGGAVFTSPSAEVDYVYDSLRLNRGFIQNETIAFVNAKYPNLQYNEASCSRDTGFIVDAVATDLRWGGNQRSVTAGEFYYRFPSIATSVQLGETTDAITYASDLVREIILQNELTKPTASLNTDFNIKTTLVPQVSGVGTTETRVLSNVSASFGLVMDVITNGTGSLPTLTEYTASLSDSDTLNAYNIVKSNIPFIQSEVIAYISSSWNGFGYNEASCSRDVGFIVSGAIEDLLWNANSASIVNGKYYFEFPSDATGSQLDQTLDGIRYAARITNKIIQGVTLEFPSTEASSSWELLRSNRAFIQSESIAYISSSWSTFEYNQETCKRDVGYIIDAIATDIKYGGTERSVTAGDFYYRYPSTATSTQLEPTTTGIGYAGDLAEKVIVNEVFVTASAERIAGNQTLLQNRQFIQSESIAYISSSWSNFSYNQASCSRDTGFIVDAVATDLLYGGNERSRTAGEYYFKFPSSATVGGTESPNVNAQLYPTLDGIEFAGGISEKLLQNIEFVTASSEVSASWHLLRDNKAFIQDEVIEYVSSSWSGVRYNEEKCRRDVGYLIDAVATDIYYGGNERSVTAGSFYYLFPSRATNRGVPSEQNQLDPTIDGINYAKGLSQKVIQNTEFVQPSASVLVGADLLIGNREFIQKEVITFLSSSWSEFEYNEASCSRDVGYIIDAVRTDLVYGGNERSIQAGRFYYYIPSVATSEQKPQTIDGINFAKGMAEKVILKDQLVRPTFETRISVDLLRGNKKDLQAKATSYTNGAFPNFVYNEEKCYRDTGFIVDAIATDLFYGGNERSTFAASSYYTGVYGSAAVVVNEQKLETAETNRYLRTQFQRIVRNSPLELFGSLIITTGHDFSYSGAGVTYKALPPNQGGAGVPDPTKEIVELDGGRVFFTAGNELGDFKIGTGLIINQATGTLQGRTFSRSLFSLVTPFSLALEG